MALICPRPIQLQAGDRDAVHHSQPGQTLAAEASEYYRKVGREAAFERRIFPGGHEFNDELAWAFVAPNPVTHARGILGGHLGILSKNQTAWAALSRVGW